MARSDAAKALWIAVCVAFLAAPAAAADKTDVVVLHNGDRITGEVKSLDRGKLTFKTDSMGTVYIEWDDVAEISSEQSLEVELDTGEKHFGTLGGEAPGELQVVSDSESATLELASVIRMVPIEGSFWKRVDGSFDLGLNFASSNETSTFNLGAEGRYRSRKYSRRIGLSSTLVDQEDAERTRRNSADVSWQRFLPKRRFTDLGLQFQENEELGLEPRSLVKVVFGNHAIQRPHLRLDLFGGLAENHEDFVGSDPTTSTELVAGLDLEFFRFDDPETDISLDFFVYPSLTSSGRVRAELNTRIRRELVKDFFFALSLYDSFDSEPPMEGLPENDWGFNTSLGWKF